MHIPLTKLYILTQNCTYCTQNTTNLDQKNVRSVHIAEKIEFTQNSANSWIAPKSSPKVQTENIPAHRHSWPRNWTQNIQKSSKTWYFIPSPKLRTNAKAKNWNTCNIAIVRKVCRSRKLHWSNCLWSHSESDRRLKRWHKQARVSCEIGHRASRNRPPPTSKIEK